ncbi:MAG: hypothetical protein KGM42_06220 [Hyphomicrobiales bacterium]|nr:hypothetical protein [Hyphomicrobiales bacterium]
MLLRWGILYTGIDRLDDGALFGLFCCILLTAFMVSAVGLLLFRARGLSFTLGWMLGVPVCIAALLVYCRYKPFPSYDDLSWMFCIAGAAHLAALTIVRGIKALEDEGDEETQDDEAEKPAKKQPPARAAHLSIPFRKSYRQTVAKRNEAQQDRLNLAMRPQSGRGRRF